MIEVASGHSALRCPDSDNTGSEVLSAIGLLSSDAARPGCRCIPNALTWQFAKLNSDASPKEPIA